MTAQKKAKAAKRKAPLPAWLRIAAMVLLCAVAVAVMPAINARQPDLRRDNFVPFTTDAPVYAQAPTVVEASEAETSAEIEPFEEAQPLAEDMTDEPEPLEEDVTEDSEPIDEAETEEPIGEAEPSEETDAAEAIQTDDGEAEDKGTVITVTAVGDCTLGGDTNSSWGESRFYDYVKKKGYDYFFSGVRDIFEKDDLTVINLEGPLTKRTRKRSGRKFNFRGKPEYVNILTGSSIEICNVANNHALDFKKDGLKDTAATLEKAGIGASGFTVPYYTEVNGKKVCSLGFTQWDLSSSKMVRMVKDAREKSDLVIVSIHWGKERVYKMPSDCKKLGKKLIDAGADLVIGNHSHVVGEICRYKGKYIIYSLGNFCFGGNKNPDDKNCAIFQQSFSFDGDGNVRDAGINIIPAYVSSKTSTNDYCPQVLKGSAGTKLLKKIAKLSNLSAEGTVWMENSYEIENNIVEPNS